MLQIKRNLRPKTAHDVSSRYDNTQNRGEALHKYPAFLQRILPWLLSSGLFIGALSCNLYQLGQPGIWFDEAFSVELARQPFSLLLRIIFQQEPNMELYYLFLAGWLHLLTFFGIQTTEWMMRFPSACFAAFATTMIFILGRRYLGTFAGFVAALLYLMNVQQLIYAQQVRAYALQLLLICVAWYALFRLLDPTWKSKSPWLIFTITMTLALYTHLFSALVLLAQVISVIGIFLFTCLFASRIETQKALRGYIVPFCLSLIIIFLLCLPLLYVSLQGPRTGWLPTPKWQDINHVFVLISGNNTAYLHLLRDIVIFLLFIAFITSCWRIIPVFRQHIVAESQIGKLLLSYQQLLPLIWALGCWLTAPLLASYFLSQGPIHLFSARYLIVIVPPLCLLVAMGVAALRWRLLQILCAGWLLFSTFLIMPIYYQSAQVEDWNSTVHWLLDRYQKNDGLICYDSSLSQGCQIAVEYYLHTYSQIAHFTPDAPGAFSWENFGLANPHSNFEAPLQPAALTTYVANHPRFFYIVGRVPDNQAAQKVQETEQWLNQHYHLMEMINTRTVTIRLYQH